MFFRCDSIVNLTVPRDYNQNTPQQNAFIAWLQTYLDQGIPVIAGFFERKQKRSADHD